MESVCCVDCPEIVQMFLFQLKFLWGGGTFWQARPGNISTLYHKKLTVLERGGRDFARPGLPKMPPIREI